LYEERCEVKIYFSLFIFFVDNKFQSANIILLKYIKYENISKSILSLLQTVIAG